MNPMEKADAWNRVPPNVSFEIDDVESPWPPREPFDFIHSRYMLGSIQDWPKLLRQSYEYVSDHFTQQTTNRAPH